MKRFLNNKKAQNTAEYAILIALVIGAVVAMQTYVQRAFQGRIRGANQYLANTVDQEQSGLGATAQYEPYYQSSSSQTARTSSDRFTDSESNTSTNAVTDDGALETTAAPLQGPVGEE